MIICIKCLKCAGQINADSANAGGTVECPSCGNVTVIPQLEKTTQPMPGFQGHEPESDPVHPIVVFGIVVIVILIFLIILAVYVAVAT